MNRTLIRLRNYLYCFFMLAGVGNSAMAAELDAGKVDGFIAEMVARHAFDQASLTDLFAEVERSDRIIELMTRPAEKVKPWWQYRAIFISDKRIRDGVKFWRRHFERLSQAQETYGVPAHVIVAIIGVETSYGKVIGSHRVMDALSTLAFHYPGGNERRAKYFRAQLEHFLLFTREDKLSPLALEGSYAGALGMPQFMPENYRKLAVDFDGDGARDIWKNPADAIGSVANYLSHHGWQRGLPVMSPARVVGSDFRQFLGDDIKPQHSLEQLASGGISPMQNEDDQTLAARLFELSAKNGHEYWLGYENFYVISRYNPRVKYTMAVAQLAESIRDTLIESL